MPKQTKSETAPAQTKVTAKTTEKAAAAPKTEKSAATPKTEKPSKTATTTAPATTETTVVASESKPSKSSKKQSSKTTESATPSSSAVVAESVSDVVSTETVSVTSEFTDFMTKLQQLSAVVSSLKTEFRLLEKKASRELKTAAKASHKRKRKTGNRSPSGFVKPTLISDELAAFLGKGKGTQMARTEVTREINAYIRANQLQDKTNGRRINADTNLASLLKLTSGEELTYFNLQRYMSPHFAKSSAAPVASA